MKRLLGTVFFLAIIGILVETDVAAESNANGTRISIGGVLAPTNQSENTATPHSPGNQSRGSGPFQLEMELSPVRGGVVFVKMGFAAGNGLNDLTSFNLAPWAADQESDVRNINGRSRDHLLNAWYRHSFYLGRNHFVSVTAGIIDAADYLDQNKYANDEYTQFMNEALVNGPNSFAPSYDYGGSVSWTAGAVSLTAVAMQVGENIDGNQFDFYGAQIGLRIESGPGEGNFRIVVESTDDAFLDPSGKHLKSRSAALLSCDQQIGKFLGIWARLGRQDNSAAIGYKDLYSGGIDIRGSLWNRKYDNIGIAYGFLDGGNLDLQSTEVIEAYCRVSLSETIQLTGDIQYIKDDLKNGNGQNGVIYSLRLTAMF